MQLCGKVEFEEAQKIRGDTLRQKVSPHIFLSAKSFILTQILRIPDLKPIRFSKPYRFCKETPKEQRFFILNLRILSQNAT